MHDHSHEHSPIWNKLLAPYMRADDRRALFQLLTTAIPFATLWYLMLRSLEVSYFLTLVLAVPAAGLLIRLFIFQHDCGHGAFFSSQRANNALGVMVGIVMMTPYQYWRRTHAMHHAGSGNLDRRTFGEIETLTVREYLDLSWWGRVRYRLYRNPVVLLGIGPFFQFVVKHRFPYDTPFSWKREWSSVWVANIAWLGILVVSWQTFGLKSLLLVHLPILLIAGVVGVFLFYVQHQFEDTYWRARPEWDFHRAGLEGCSFYDLPAVLRWFTGNIGYHHIHHLASKIPNYRLREAMEKVPELSQVTRLTFWKSFKTLRLKLWDEDERRLVGFRHLRRLRS